jgi:3-hydroxyisobutyrate dehydrogenase
MSNNLQELFPVGKLVWAKVQGFSPWPAKVENESDLPSHVLSVKPSHKAVAVFFFGSHEFGWIQQANLQEYEAFKETLSKKNKSKQFLKGLEEIEDPSLWPEMSSFQSFIEPERKRKSTSGSGVAKKLKV